MIQGDNNRVVDFFAGRSRALTPASMLQDAQVLYAPALNDPEFTRCCAATLSAAELHRAERFVRRCDKSLFIQRRAFRRFCGVLAAESSRLLSEVVFEETDNGRPYLPELPNFCFSFSSCGNGFLGAWSSMHGVGVDIEDRAGDSGASELARQYFSVAEAGVVEGPGGRVDLQSFLQFWTLKEAALKSIGEGLPFGLNAFQFQLDPGVRVVQAPTEYGGPERFSAYLLEGAVSCSALVFRRNLS